MATAKINRDHIYLMVYMAIKDGTIEKPLFCSDCGEKKRLHGHHDNYDKPLDLVWLCCSCHHKRHPRKGIVSKRYLSTRSSVVINFDCEDWLKEKFESAIKVAGYSTMAEAFRDYMRKTVSTFPDMTRSSVDDSTVQNSVEESQEKSVRVG